MKADPPYLPACTACSMIGGCRRVPLALALRALVVLSCCVTFVFAWWTWHDASLVNASAPTLRKVRVFVTASSSRYNRHLYAALGPLIEVVEAPYFLPCNLQQEQLRRLLNGSRWVHLAWPEYFFRPGHCIDTLANHRRLIDMLKQERVRIMCTMHNLMPHSASLAQKNATAQEFHAIYSAWLSASNVLLHHSHVGIKQVQSRYNISHARNIIAYHGFFDFPTLSRAAAEKQLGLNATGLRIGIFGSPRDGKQTLQFLRGVAAPAFLVFFAHSQALL